MSTLSIPRNLTVSSIRKMYKNGEITPEDLVKEIIQRAKEDKDMNIWITPPILKFIQPYLEGLNEINFESSPLWGIPFAIKDNIDLAGVPTTAGCAEYAYIPNEHAAVVGRLIAAGAIPIGKTNLDQFATGLVGTRSPYGETKNALRKELISGGSSSGSAVSVARGQAAFSLGTDTAGSGRVPAALNNLVGYKPSLGAWSTKGVVPACASLDCVTVFAHTLEDALLVDKAARGAVEGDPWCRDLPKLTPNLPETILLPNKELTFFGPYADEYRLAWETTIEKWKNLPVSIQYIDIEIFEEAAKLLYGGPFVAERWADLGAFIDSHSGATYPVTEEVLRSGEASGYDAASVFKAMHKLQALKVDAKKTLNDTVVVMPTSGGTWTRDQVREDPIKKNSDMGLYTNHCNLLDLCAVALPAGEATIDTPFGISLFALSENEGLIIGAAELFVNNSSSEVETTTYLEKQTTFVAVCGLHMRGFPLEKQMIESGAIFVKEAKTAEKYHFFKLPTNPAKPGLIKVLNEGKAISLELWEMPLTKFGAFAASIPAPLGIGKIELENGEEVPGFICEGYAIKGAEDITDAGGWRNI